MVTVIKSTLSDSFQTIGHYHFRQPMAISECTLTYGSHAIGNSYCCQFITTAKSSRANGRYITGNRGIFAADYQGIRLCLNNGIAIIP